MGDWHQDLQGSSPGLRKNIQYAYFFHNTNTGSKAGWGLSSGCMQKTEWKSIEKAWNFLKRYQKRGPNINTNDNEHVLSI